MMISNQQMPHPAFLESIFALVFTAILKNEKMRKSSYSTLRKERIREKHFLPTFLPFLSSCLAISIKSKTSLFISYPVMFLPKLAVLRSFCFLLQLCPFYISSRTRFSFSSFFFLLERAFFFSFRRNRKRGTKSISFFGLFSYRGSPFFFRNLSFRFPISQGLETAFSRQKSLLTVFLLRKGGFFPFVFWKRNQDIDAEQVVLRLDKHFSVVALH